LRRPPTKLNTSGYPLRLRNTTDIAAAPASANDGRGEMHAPPPAIAPQDITMRTRSAAFFAPSFSMTRAR
jgi:hypothetical protein